MKVYVIMQGMYSDKHVCGVVTSEEEAQEFCHYLSKDDSFVWFGDAWYEEYDTEEFSRWQEA